MRKKKLELTSAMESMGEELRTKREEVEHNKSEITSLDRQLDEAFKQSRKKNAKHTAEIEVLKSRAKQTIELATLIFTLNNSGKSKINSDGPPDTDVQDDGSNVEVPVQAVSNAKNLQEELIACDEHLDTEHVVNTGEHDYSGNVDTISSEDWGETKSVQLSTREGKKRVASDEENAPHGESKYFIKKPRLEFTRKPTENRTADRLRGAHRPRKRPIQPFLKKPELGNVPPSSDFDFELPNSEVDPAVCLENKENMQGLQTQYVPT
jgi:hypothetical protein